jgi:hypothetical protein
VWVWVWRLRKGSCCTSRAAAAAGAAAGAAASGSSTNSGKRRWQSLRPTLYTLRVLCCAVIYKLCMLCLQGWKKFMEVSKVMEGFTLAGSLVIKAQVQVIR